MQIPIEREPELSDVAWAARFAAHMIKRGKAGAAADEFRRALDGYAQEVARVYLKDRAEFADPEEAADTDISYWEAA